MDLICSVQLIQKPLDETYRDARDSGSLLLYRPFSILTLCKEPSISKICLFATCASTFLLCSIFFSRQVENGLNPVV